MPTKTMALEKDGPKRLELSWNGFWRNFTVKVDGNTIATADGQGALKAGVSGTLPDGTRLDVRLNTGFGNTGLAITRDGVPLPGTATDPVAQVKLAGGIVYFLAGLNVLLGIIAFAFDVEYLKQAFGYGPLVIGAIFGILGYFTMKRSLAALITAIVLYGLDGIITLGMQLSTLGSGRTPNVGFIFMRILFLMAMIRGASAITKIRESSK